MVQSMRSGAFVQPGETYRCVGCHEKRVGEAAPVAERLKATPRGDVEESFVPCAKDQEREARYQRRLSEERRFYGAIRAGRKAYDE